MESEGVDLDLPVATVLARWPQTVRVFLRRRMACVGCAIAPFHTLADVAKIYGLPAHEFVGELQQSIREEER